MQNETKIHRIINCFLSKFEMEPKEHKGRRQTGKTTAIRRTADRESSVSLHHGPY